MSILFDTMLKNEPSDSLLIAFNKGDWAGSQGHRRDENPYENGSSLHEWWDAGWSNAYDELCGT